MRAMTLVAANIAVAAFNLLPIGSLDGGEAARLLCGWFFKPKLAYALSRAFSFLALVPLFAAAVFLLLRPERNFTLVVLCTYLLIDIILKG
jgi:stage IV sporulation protein FB